MPWPLSQDYNEAIQSPDSSFADVELCGGQSVNNALGMPMPRSGNFADVYEFIGASGAKWAIKCFTREVPGLQERYHQIDLHLLKVKLPFTVNFQYQPGGIRIRGQWFPILKMQWVEGFLLNEFVRNNLDKPALLEGLGQIWLRMARRLREADMAHADLQHGNVLLVPGSKATSLAVKLIDYDGMFVPALARTKSGEIGHPNYQHPQRLREGIYSAEVDRFPLLVVATALRALAVGGRQLWDRYDNGDNLLFRETDLKVPDKSTLFKELHTLSDAQLRKLAEELHQSSARKLEEVAAIDELLPEPKATKPASPLAPGKPPAPPVEVGAESAAADTRALLASPLVFDDDQASVAPKPKAKRGVPTWVWLAGGGTVAAGVLVVIAVAIVMMVFLGGDRNKGKDLAQGNDNAAKDKPPKDNPPKDGKKKVPNGDPVPPPPQAKRFPATVPANTAAKWRVEGVELVQDAVVPDVSIFFGDPKWTDYDFSVDAKLTENAHGFALWFCRADDQNAFIYALGPFGNTLHVVHSIDKGKWSQHAARDIKDAPLKKHHWYSATLSVRGDNGLCFLDGVKQFDFKIDRRSAGAVGLRTWNAACRFKNIRVTAPDGTVLLEGVPDLAPAPPVVAVVLALEGRTAPEFVVQLHKNALRACMSTDGRRVAYSDGQVGYFYYREAPAFDVEKKVAMDPKARVEPATSSLDGKKMTFTSLQLEGNKFGSPKVLVWNWETTKVEMEIATPHPANGAVLSPDTKHLAIHSVWFDEAIKKHKFTLRLVDVSKGKELRSWQTQTPINGYGFTPDSTKFFYRQFNEDSCHAYTVEGLTASVLNLPKRGYLNYFSADFTHLAQVEVTAKQLHVSALDPTRPVRTLQSPQEKLHFRAAAVSPDNRYLIVGLQDTTKQPDVVSQAALVDLKDGEVLGATAPRDGMISQVQVAANGLALLQGFKHPASLYRFPTRSVDVVVKKNPEANGDTTPSAVVRFAAVVPSNTEGKWHVEGNEVVQDVVKPNLSLYFGNPTWTDYDFSVEAMRTAGDDQFSLWFRRKDDQHSYICMFGNAKNASHIAGLFEKGVVKTQLAVAKIKDDAAPLTLPSPPNRGEGRVRGVQTGKWHIAVVKVRGNKGEAYFDGAKLFDFKVSQFAGGAVGLRTSSAAYRFKNIKVTAPDGAVLLQGLPNITTGPDAAGFVSLFNGADLAGWQPHAKEPGNWRVINGILTGSGKDGSLTSVHDDYKDFHLRMEARINDGGTGNVFVRAAYDDAAKKGFKWLGYQAMLWDRPNGYKIGSLSGVGSSGMSFAAPPNKDLAKAGEWFTLEVIADGPSVSVKVNGITSVGWLDAMRQYPMSGRIALQVSDAKTTIEFRKIEIKESNPANTPSDASKRFAATVPPNSAGTWRVQGEELVQNSKEPGQRIIFGKPQWTDYDLRVEAMRTKGDDRFGLFFRRASDARWYAYRLGAVRNMVHLVVLRNGTAASQPAIRDNKDNPLQDGRWYAAKVKVRGEHGECYLDGVKLFDFKADKHAAGAVGLETEASSYRFKNIKVTAPDGTILLEGLPDLTPAGPRG